jgi:hypothetical protein
MKGPATYAGDPRHHHTDVHRLEARVAELEARVEWLETSGDALADHLRTYVPWSHLLIAWESGR